MPNKKAKKEKTKKKRIRICYLSTQPDEIFTDSFANAKQHNLLFSYSFFEISVMVLLRWKKVLFSVIKFI